MLRRFPAFAAESSGAAGALRKDLLVCDMLIESILQKTALADVLPFVVHSNTAFIRPWNQLLRLP